MPPPKAAPKGNFGGDVPKSPGLSPALPVTAAPPSPVSAPDVASPVAPPKIEDDIGPTVAGIIKKKSQKNRHIWNSRYVELRGRDLVFFRTKADALINKGPVVAVFEDIIQVEIPKVGRGVEEGTRFNIRLHSLNAIVNANPMKTMRAGLLELQAPDPRSCIMWTHALKALGIPLTEGPLPSDMLPEATETVSPDAKAQLLLRFGGLLKKKSRKVRGLWVSRWLVLQDTRVSYYRSEEDARDDINPTHVPWSEIVSVTLAPGANGKQDPTRFVMTIRDREPLEWQASKEDCKGWMLLFEKKMGSKGEPALPPRPKPRAKSPSPHSPSTTPTTAPTTPTTPTVTPVATPTTPTTQPAPIVTKLAVNVGASPTAKPQLSPAVKSPEASPKPTFAPIPNKPAVSPVIAPTKAEEPVKKPVSTVAPADRLRELLRVGGPVKKKGVQYPHNWHVRYMIVVDEQLCYYANAEDCAQNINAKVVPLFDILSLKLPTRGRGAAEGLRFNMEMVGGALLEWQGLTKEATHDWAQLFEKFGITETSAAARQKARASGEKKDSSKDGKEAAKDPHKETAAAKEEKVEEKIKEEKPVYRPGKSKTGVYTIKPVIGLRVVTHENKGVLVAAITAEPAAAAGLRKGDIVVSVNGSRIKTENDCLAALKSAKIDDKLTFVVTRGGTERTCVVTVGIKEPESKAKFVPKAIRAALENAAKPKEAAAGGASDNKQCALCDRLGHTSKDHECSGCRAVGLHRGRYCPSCPPAVGLSWDEGANGCTVTTLDSGSAAEIAGLQAGDLLEKIEKTTIRTGADIRKSMEGVKPGLTLEFHISRAGKRELIRVRVLARRNKKFGVKNLVDGVKNQIAR